MRWANKKNKNVAMILLDFEKSYDRIEWPFVIRMLKPFGFPEYSCRWIEVLFKYSSTVIDASGNLTNPIPLGRSIRKGFPISPSLFVIAVDALLYILRAPSLGPPIKVILLPNVDNLLNSQFDDDSVLFLEIEENIFLIPWIDLNSSA